MYHLNQPPHRSLLPPPLLLLRRILLHHQSLLPPQQRFLHPGLLKNLFWFSSLVRNLGFKYSHAKSLKLSNYDWKNKAFDSLKLDGLRFDHLSSRSNWYCEANYNCCGMKSGSPKMSAKILLGHGTTGHQSTPSSESSPSSSSSSSPESSSSETFSSSLSSPLSSLAGIVLVDFWNYKNVFA